MAMYKVGAHSLIALGAVVCMSCAADTPSIAGSTDSDGSQSFSYSTSAPLAPTALTASAASGMQINLQWRNDDTKKSNLLIESRTSTTTVYTTVAVVSASATSYQHTGLAAGTVYAYHVRACLETRCSDRPAEASATTLAAVTPTPTTTTAAATAAPTVTTRAATLIATSSATVGGVVTANRLASTAWTEYSTTSSFTTPSATTARATGDGTTAIAFEDHLTGLVAGTTYYYRAVASNSAGRTNGPTLSFTTNLK